MKSPAPKPKIKVVIWLAGTLFAVGCVLWLAYRIVYEREAALFTAPPATVLLHSKLRYDEVVVPFTFASGQICVQAKINGKNRGCCIDTGTALALMPQILDLANPNDVLYSSVQETDAGGNKIEARRALLKDLRISDYELKDISVLVAPSATSAHLQANPNYQCLLGNSVFSRIVFTVDDRLHQVILRSREYNPATQRHAPQSYSFPFRWASSVTSAKPFGSITVSGTISGRPATFAVDTGWCGNTMGISREAYRRFFASSISTDRRAIPTAFGQAKGIYIPDLACSLKNDDPHHPDLKFHQPALVVADQDDGADAIWGYAVLKDYRVTIDYPRQRIFLEPYALTGSKK